MLKFGAMQKRKIVVLLGHPDGEKTLSKDMADVYAASAEKAGHEVRRFNLAEMQFDPILHKAYKTIQELEPDLVTFQEALKWADHFVLVYPNWWCTMPALLKGLFDRTWLPGFCFHFRKRADGSQALGWTKMMKSKTARVIVLSGTRPLFIYMLFGDYTNEIKCGILGFAGFKVRLTRIGPTEHSSDAKRSAWQKKVSALGKKGI